MQTIALENRRGFTLIELVIVIVLIGILAATALPKFSNLTSQAQIAANQGVAGGLGAGVSIAHAAWLALGQPTTPITNGDFTNLSVNINGWPDGGAALVNPTGAQCQTVWNAVLNNPPVLTVGTSCTGSGCYWVPAAAAANCTFTLGTSGRTITYNTTTGAVGYN